MAFLTLHCIMKYNFCTSAKWLTNSYYPLMDCTREITLIFVYISKQSAASLIFPTGYQSHRTEFEHINFYWAPVYKNNIPVHLALLGGWVPLNTKIVTLSALNFYTHVMRRRKKQYDRKITAA